MWKQFFHLLKLLVLFPFKVYKLRQQAKSVRRGKVKTIGIMHIPAHTNAGGEKVLWSLTNFLIKLGEFEVVVYCDVIESKDKMIEKVNRFFGLNVDPSKIRLVQVKEGNLTYSHHYTFFSRYLEALSHFLVLPCAFEGFMPDLFIDTMTAHFAMPAVKLIDPRIKVVNYVHYPFTGRAVVNEYTRNYKNAANTPKVRVFNFIKSWYHWVLFKLYERSGKSCDLAMSNSSWTLNHTISNWGGQTQCELLFPPCNVDEFWCDDMEAKEEIMISFAQFRPEKRHDLQLDIFKKFQEENPGNNLQFKMVGTIKDSSSQKIADALEQRIKDEGIQNVELMKNIPFNEIRTLFSRAIIGAHFMIDEHFGISVVELMAAGMVVLAHNSAGPKNDILYDKHSREKYGYLCEDEEYLPNLNLAYRKLMAGGPEKQELVQMVERGRQRLKGLVSNEAFARKFYELIKRNLL